MGESAVVPAEAVDEVLEFVESGEGNVFGERGGGRVGWDGGGIEGRRVEAGEVRKGDHTDDSVGGIHEEVSARSVDSEEGD
jgi:hypothetical protein